MSVLIDKVAQRLGVSRDRADDLVRDLVESILAETGRGSEVHVAGLGSFRRTNGTLEFEPESRLATVVNHRFAGLSPIPVQSAADSGGMGETGFVPPDMPIDAARPEEPSYREEDTLDAAGESEHDDADIPESDEWVGPTPDDRDVADQDEDDIRSMGDDDIGSKRDDDLGSADEDGVEIVARLDKLMGDEEPGEAAESAEPGEAAESAEPGEAAESAEPGEAADSDEPRRQLPAFSRSPSHSEPEGSEGEPRAPAAAAADVTDSADDRRESAAKGRGRARDRARAPSAAEKPRPPVAKRKSRSLFYVALIVILAAAIAGVLYLLSRNNGVSAEPESFTTESMNGSPDAAEGISPPEDIPPPPEVSWEPGAIDRQAGGYTLVVSSQETIEEANERARELAAELADEELPIDVLEGAARGKTWYRVAVGQFSQESTANRELRRLADRLPEGAWVLAVRTHM